MRLILHIGTAKTGTTTLQRWFAANREGLAAQGIAYPVVPGRENHRKLMVHARDTGLPDASFARFGVRTASDHAAFRARLRDELTREVADCRARGDRVMVMSSEHLHSKITTLPMIERLRDLLAPLFPEIAILLHLRPQVDLLISNASQRARMGQAVTRAELTRDAVGPSSNFFNYSKIAGLWEAAFGAQNLRIVPFRRIPDMTGLLIRELGLDASRLAPVIRQNHGLDWRAIALANAVNAGFAALQWGAPPDYHLEGMPGAERLQLGLPLARQVQDRFAASNSALTRRRTDVTLDDLTPDWGQHSAESNLDLIEAPCHFVDQLAHMVHRFAQDLALEKWHRHRAEIRLAELAGDAAALQRAKRLAAAAASDLSRLGVAVAARAPAGPQDTATPAA